jgi:GH24 family phage-related lysozyme (muramidase)
MDIMPYIWPATVLIIFLGMLALCWRALTIAHDLAKIVLQAGLPQIAKEAVPHVLPLPPSLPATPPAPAETPVVDAGLVAFIKKEEGFRAKAYWDYKQYSIGYGTKANSATEVIDEAEGERRLISEIANAERLAEQVIPADSPKGVKQALTDLTYNAGPGWETQSLGAAVKAKKWDTVKADILQYNHAGGQVNAGLTARREAEVGWFDHPL